MATIQSPYPLQLKDLFPVPPDTAVSFLYDLKRRLVSGSTLFIDASSLDRWMHCPREFAYYYLCQRESVGDYAGRFLGKVVHAALERWYKRPATEPLAETIGHMDTIIDNFYSSRRSISDDYRTSAYAKEVVRKYVGTYPSETHAIAKLQDGTPAIEMAYAIPFCRLNVKGYKPITAVVTGKVDCVLESPDGLVVRDIKTSSIGGETFYRQFLLSQQLFGYCWAVAYITGKPVKSFVIDAIFTRAITATGKGIECMRYPYTLQPDSLDGWYNNTKEILQSISDALSEHRFPRYSAACTRRYGTCEYLLNICGLDPAAEIKVLNDPMLYDPVTWTPLEHS